MEAQIAQLAGQAKQVASKREQIADAGADGKCPTCERPLADELPTVLANFDSQAREITNSIASLTAEKAKLEQDDGGLAALEKSRESVATQLDALRKEKSVADARVSELDGIRRGLTARSAQLAILQADLAKLPSDFDPARFRALQELKESLQPDRERAASLNGELERLPKIEAESTDLSSSASGQRTRNRRVREDARGDWVLRARPRRADSWI